MKGIQYLLIKDIDMEANGEVEIADEVFLHKM